MTKRKLSKPFHLFKSFRNRSIKKQAYIQSLEADYSRQALELLQLKRTLGRA